ncbi:MAG TPA: LysM-like peptidoglycan-binding domain-containing protein, partial [Pseudomonadales bacterium]|nr:LysM-like peptidoglycan-binding domain-containing protein [Pseudomonadales bacterium]
MDAYPKSHLKMAVLAGITLAVLLTALPARESPQDAAEPISLAIRDNEAVPAPAPMPADAPESPTVAASPSDANWQRFKTRRGDSLSALFERAGLSPQDLHAVMQAGGDARDLRDILPGKTVAMQIDTKGNLEALKYKASPVRDLLVTRTDSGSYQADWQAIEPKILLSWATGAITADQPSLYQAAKRAGLSDKMIMNLADIFQ